MNAILSCVLANGNSVIKNVAKEPHIVDLANFLNLMGAKITGAGTNVIKIKGVKQLKPIDEIYPIIPDQIEAGTFMVAAAATKGNVTINGCIPKHLETIIEKLKEANVTVIEGENSVQVINKETPKSITINTAPHPGFPTDMQPQFGVLETISDKTGIITENIWESRFQYTDELIKMGANITTIHNTAIFSGVSCLSASKVSATDLRAGAALIIAGLIANGNTEIYNISHILRGYENIIDKLTKLGADIKLVKEDEN